MKLTVKGVERALKKPGRYRDGRGLLLQVNSATNASWVFRYERGGRERWLGLGPLSLLSLAEARDKAHEARKLLFNGIDPMEQRKAEKAAKAIEPSAALSFEEAARQYFDQHQQKWRNPKHRAQFLSTLEQYAFPLIGRVAISQIDTPRVIAVLEQRHANYPDQRLWDAIPETANRLRGRIEQVLDWATVRGHRTGDNSARWKGHLDNVLPPRGSIRKVKHHPALAYAQIPDFMAELRRREGIAARALEFLILTAAPTGAVIGARRDEVDFEQKVWTVPPDRAETKISVDQPRRVPLSDRAMEILKGLPIEDGNPYLFIGGKAGSGISNMAMAELMKDLAWPSTTPDRLATVHGFRSSFKDWVSETTNFPNHVSEAALWHAVADKVEAAYRRGDLFNKRRRLMVAWAQYCTALPLASAKVVPMRGAR
ncbi:integrase arm-type DNA-binding domain-containing protein [Bradyrhizobium yuanmingense]|uniref:tyrosine-type recombinase/integrase n=1 Tax=Bradyrhizobium yuanmingense TaxID=108015 RepID=UPI0023B9B15D|nr:site-specific integrase [Bradyrhizobium yuanmingense]MDF0521591.1 integrase arm-type DNA-binding domain-containing protein [Bradyrhizobium yuanmingense]